MTTVNTITEEQSATVSPGQRLQATMAAARVGFTWFGVRKTLTPAQKAQAAEAFGAEDHYLSAAKKLLDTHCQGFQAVTAVRNSILAYWWGMSLPYPEPGIRLVRQYSIEPFNQHMTEMRQEFIEAVEALDRQLPDLKEDARRQLGELYNPSDYPPSLRDLFTVEWDFPSVEPPDYLLQLNPRLYEQQRQLMVSRFEEAVKMAEQAFAEEFGKLVAHLTERLTGADDGKPKVFRDSVVGNLQEFFERFRSLNVRSNEELDRLVETAQRALRGVAPQDLRDSQGLRQQIVARLGSLQSSLDALLVDRPRRRILRPSGQEEGT